MDDPDRPDVDLPSTDDADPSVGSEHLLELLDQLRMSFEMITPEDQVRRPDAVGLIRHAQERIATLERMLAWTRAREAELTARTVRGEMKVAHLESTVHELDSIAKRTSEADAGRLQAETKAAELQRELTAARGELQVSEAEVRRLSARYRELESDLATVADELASSTVARAKAERLEHERDIALESARTESRAALDERLRAAQAERRVELLRERLHELEQRSMPVTDMYGELEPDEAGDETIVLPEDELEEDELEEDELEEDELEDDQLVDLTEEQSTRGYEAAGGPDEPIVWTAPAKRRGFVEWLSGGNREDDE